MIIEVNGNIDNGIKSNELLANLSEILDGKQVDEIILDFSKVDFVAANQLAVIAAIIEELWVKKNIRVVVRNISKKVQAVMQKNGFGMHLGLERKMDKYHTVIPYECFLIDGSLEFEKYLLLYIFQRKDIPLMSDTAKNTIIDNFLEIFNNVKEHANTNHIYACGQFFPTSDVLYFTIVDIGKTISENVQKYLKSISKEIEEKYYIEWALKEGNSTRINNAPGGLGLSMINKFISLNKGNLMVMSGDEIYEYSKNKSRFLMSEHYFKGTIVTIGINMTDSFAYLAINDNIEQILF